MMTCRVVESGEVVIVLVELGLVEQRYQAVLEVLNDASTVTDVAVRFGVTRQTVHRWLRRYAADGIAGLVDHVSTPGSCPHQMRPEVEVRIVELCRLNPGWGPRTILFQSNRVVHDPPTYITKTHAKRPIDRPKDRAWVRAVPGNRAIPPRTRHHRRPHEKLVQRPPSVTPPRPGIEPARSLPTPET